VRREAIGRHGAVQSVVGEKKDLRDVHNCINILGRKKGLVGDIAWLRRCKSACISTKIWGLCVQDTACGGLLASYTCRNTTRF
jgi:hypothetical protein